MYGRGNYFDDSGRMSGATAFSVYLARIYLNPSLEVVNVKKKNARKFDKNGFVLFLRSFYAHFYFR